MFMTPELLLAILQDFNKVDGHSYHTRVNGSNSLKHSSPVKKNMSSLSITGRGHTKHMIQIYCNIYITYHDHFTTYIW